MARDPTTAELSLQINSTNNSSSILTVDGRYRVTTASPNEIVLSGCSTTTGTDAIIYWLTSTNYGATSSTNIFTAGTYHSRTFIAPSNGIRPLYGSNTSGDIYTSSTNLGQAKNNGGSAYYYVYAANIDGQGVWGNFKRCTFSNSVTGVSSYYLTVTWTSALPTPTLYSGSTTYGTWPTSNTTNTLESGNKVVLRKDDIAYAIDLDVGTTYSDNVWYATTYNSTTTAGVSNPLSGNAGRTFTLAQNNSRARLEANSSDNRIVDLNTTEGYYQLHRLWGRIYPGTSNPNTTNGKQWDGLYYQKGVTYTVYHPDTGVSVPSSVSIGASDTQTNVTVSGISSSDQNAYQWQYNGSASGTLGAGSISPTSHNIPITTNLPASGTSRDYNLYVKMYATNSNSTALHNNWIDTGQVTTVTRGAATSYSVSASPTSINEGQSTTWTVTYSGITSARTVNYTISGINSSDLSSGSLTGSFSISSGSGTATTSITLQSDSATEGTETATLTLDSTDSTGASTGSPTPSASVTIADTSTQGGSSGSSGSIGGGSAETYGLEITNVAGTSVIINNNSRIGTFLNSASITINNTNQSGQLFTNSNNGGAIDCSDNTIIGMHTVWTGSAWLHPVVTRNSSTGITVTRLSFGTSDPNNFWGGTLTISLIRY